MSTIDVRMPADQNEGTEASIGRWLKNRGDLVHENEPLIEISTDKVTLEIAAPGTGTLLEIFKSEGDAVFAGELLGRIGSAEAKDAKKLSEAALPSSGMSMRSSMSDVQVDKGVMDSFSPGVRRLLREHDLDPKRVPKLGRGGRLTIEDVNLFLAGDSRKAVYNTVEPVSVPERTGRFVPHTPMRRSIANHMTRSLQTAPHVTSVFEADLSRVLMDRERRKGGAAGEAPSVTAYLMFAALQAIKKVPEVNSKWHEDAIEIFSEVHFGFGAALENGGLVVPVIHDAQLMDIETLSTTLRELTNKARSGKLTRADMEGGTFTLSNHGVSGSLLAAPIILPHGQAAILGAGKLQRRVVVGESGGRELFRIRPMMYVTLTVDHRVLDGQQTNRFLTEFVAALEAHG
jgi:2-oxoglutarate dehydrogenase E2 component (dihydrolipoamide succinyltransferase)